MPIDAILRKVAARIKKIVEVFPVGLPIRLLPVSDVLHTLELVLGVTPPNPPQVVVFD